MSLIIRIDVDRPYGRRPFVRHVLSRVASDFYLPRINPLGYLRELTVFLDFLLQRRARAHLFFRRCTLPPMPLVQRLCAEGHVVGWHLEDSRSFQTFLAEKTLLERHLGQSVWAFSKHGSGGHKYGWHHQASYEPESYIEWAREAGLRVFLGNLQDPTLPRVQCADLIVFPSAFWLEPDWRDTTTFPVEWLLAEARTRDIVLLVHPENTLASPTLMNDLDGLLRALDTKVFGPSGALA